MIKFENRDGKRFLLIITLPIKTVYKKAIRFS